MPQAPKPEFGQIDQAMLQRRREGVFLILAGVFLGTLTMLNILGISRFIKLASMTIHPGKPDAWELTFAVAIGVLPYPVTFLCTDLICEFFGRRRANLVVWVGLALNLWVVVVLWIGGMMPGFESRSESGQLLTDAGGRLPVFFEIRTLTLAAVGASMVAYLAAQFIDVHLFHFWKRLTKGKALWLRNNGSTMVSQLIDTVAVILITYISFNVLSPDSVHGLPMNDQLPDAFELVVTFIAAGYAFKFLAALVDTPLIYLAVYLLKDYLQIDPTEEDDGENSAEGMFATSHP